MTIVSPPPRIDRDRYGRPLVTPPGGGKKVAYTRCTTYVDAIEDKFGLQKWLQRMTALGLADRPDLLLSVSAHREDKTELDKICEAAKEHAGATAAATTGTALHALTELVDRGQDLPVLPEDSLADLEAYRAATNDLTAVYIEEFCVQDQLQVGGTPDRIVELGGERYIADIKTGQIEYGIVKIAAQLAMYAHCALYDPATGERTHHHASPNRGIIIHLPAGQARCELIWVDLEAGWQAVQVAKQVREMRRLKYGQLTKALTGEPARPSMRKEQADAAAAEHPLVREIRACTTAEKVRHLWVAHAGEWTEELTTAAKDHIADLGQPERHDQQAS